MATGSWITLADLTSRMDGADKQAYIAEMLSQSIALMQDMPFKEGSEIFGHEFAFRTSIPQGSWRYLNSGTAYGKSTTGKSRIGMGSLTGYSQIDKLLATASGNVPMFRKNEDVAFIEGMGQTYEQTLWYGNTATNPASFMGFATFYNTITQTTAQNAVNVIDGGGSGNNNSSVWLVCWGDRTVFGVYPRGSKAGLVSEDLADTRAAYDNLGNPYEAWTTYFEHNGGLCPQDWRQVARIANIDVTSAGLAGPNAYDLFLGLSSMVMLPPMLTKESSGITETDAPGDPAPGIRPVMYTNRTVRFWMDAQGMRDRNVLYTPDKSAGVVQDMFRGIPVKISDRLLTTEGQVT
jgi:hypothetical protein